MKVKKYRSLRLQVYSFLLSNGLKVYLIPKPGFTTLSGVISINFGSIHANCSVFISEKTVPLQRGIAHFLEHRIFEGKERSMFEVFSNRGASVNAYTSHEKTLYFFNSSNHVEENVGDLLSFVQNLEVTEEDVEKEKNIIIEELRMYDDIPDFRLQKGILKNMYQVHEVRNDIGGEIEDVQAINAPLLQATHRAFYHPSNMILTVSGDFDVEKLRNFIVENQANIHYKRGKIKWVKELEPKEAHNAYVQEGFNVSSEKCCIGFKLPTLPLRSSRLNKLKILLEFDFLIQLMFSGSSDFYHTLLQNKIITSDLHADYAQGSGYRHLLISADVYQMDEFIKSIHDHVQNYLPEHSKFEILKKQAIGKVVRDGENPARIAHNYGANMIEGYDIFEELSLIKKIKISDLDERLAELRQAKTSVYAIKKEGEV